jgi:hypothetical protein
MLFIPYIIMKKLMVVLFILLLSTTVFAEFKQPVATQGEPIGDWWTQIVDVCYNKWSVDPYFAAAMIKKESWFDEKAENIASYGKGLLQLNGSWIGGTPFPNFADWNQNMPKEGNYNNAPRMLDILNGEENLDRGCWYLSALLKHYNNDLNKTAAAYRYGWGQVDNETIDLEDDSYINSIEKYRNEYLMSVTDKPITKPVGSVTGLVVTETENKPINPEPYYLAGGICIIILSLIVVIVLGKKK